jgi:SAM-dependent methyltransferase
VTELLDEHERARVDDRDDGVFYAQPRLVHHVDRRFRERLAELYAAHLEPGDDVLDLMSSWVSHLPELTLGRVVGHGMNRTELERNSRLDDHFLQDFNDDQSLPHDDAAFDAVLCAVSVQYLQYPGPVFREVRRVLRPGGVCIVSFSNRMFPTKAIRAWRVRSMDERALLVSRYLEETGFAEPSIVREPHRRPEESDGAPDDADDPFYAVVAERP